MRSKSGLLSSYYNPAVLKQTHRHIQAFARALSISDAPVIEGDASPGSPRSPSLSLKPNEQPTTFKYGPDNGVMLGAGDDRANANVRGERVEKLTATSDFAPIHQRISRRPRDSFGQQGLTYHIMRWPLLAFFFLIIWLEFSAYVVTRQVVNVFEYSFAWWGHKARLRQEMRKATSYDEWKAGAKKMDAYLGFDLWKETDDGPYYDYILVCRMAISFAAVD